jgi:ammonia channel protein AmtB
MNDLPTALNVLFTEFYYWITVVIMFLIHVGFCTYEVGVSRRKNHLSTLLKNTMVIPVVGITFYLFGSRPWSMAGRSARSSPHRSPRPGAS